MSIAKSHVLELMRAGRMVEAEAACRRLLAADAFDAGAMQILGTVRRHMGDLDEAEQLLRRSVEITADNAEFRVSLAQLLAARGQLALSIAEFERAVAIEPRFRAARLGLARVANLAGAHALAEMHAKHLVEAAPRDADAWSALGAAQAGSANYEQAQNSLQRAVALAPDYAPARANLAAVLCEREAVEEALAQSEHALRLGAKGRGVLRTKARALMQLDRYDEAEQVLVGLTGLSPPDLDAHRLLAQLRHVRGDADFARSLREAAARDGAPAALVAVHADIMRAAGDLAGAELELRRLQAVSDDPRIASALATVLLEMQRYNEAIDAAQTALDALPNDPAVAENLVVPLLCAGEPLRAAPVVERFRLAHPTDQRWITYTIDIARQRRAPLLDEWCDLERFVRVYDLPAPRGYANLGVFHDDLRAELMTLHRQAQHPLDQSLRFGTQTSRGLLGSKSIPVQRLLELFASIVLTYQSEIGPAVTEHPLLARNTSAARIVGCWSVRLGTGGFHVNHIHPQGWVSSAYYIDVPDESRDATARAGWLKLGEPRFPMPMGTPRRFIQPQPGRLVLFPSFLWHGTTPISGGQQRLTAAFDAVPTPPPVT